MTRPSLQWVYWSLNTPVTVVVSLMGVALIFRMKHFHAIKTEHLNGEVLHERLSDKATYMG